eukprot:3281748-Amphidinium_carterae.2
MMIPPQLFDLKSPTQPPLRHRPRTPQQSWHYNPPDQPMEEPQIKLKFPEWTKSTGSTDNPEVQLPQPPPGLTQPKLETKENKKEEITPIPEVQEQVKPMEVEQPKPQEQPKQPEVRRRLTTKTTPSKDDWIATIDTGEWYDDDNEEYDEKELKAAIKEEHDSLQKMKVFTRVKRQDYNYDQLKDVTQTKWVIRWSYDQDQEAKPND